MKITDINQLDFNKLYTVADYLNWEFSERLELIKGRIFRMIPAPNVNHQTISWNLSKNINIYIHTVHCKKYTSPIDVYLGKNNSTVVQPDLIIVCDKEKIKLQGCFGAPDLVIEILSPGNSRKELDYKYHLYQEEGVKEYWVVYPTQRVLQIYSNSDGKFTAELPLVDGMLCMSPLFPDLKFDVSEIFEGMIPE